MQLTRDALERWHDQPFFDAAVKGCVVRIAYGGMYVDPATGQEQTSYMMMRVADVVNKQPYRWGPGVGWG
jgi:hypothetical protein